MAWADLTLSEQESVTIDYADTITVPEVDGELRLLGGTQLNLENCGEGDGKTYTLFTGVSELLDAQGNAITLDSSNNSISNYFDTTQPGTGFWADAILQLTADGALQLVRYTDISIPQGYTEVGANSAEELTTHSGESNVAFLTKTDLSVYSETGYFKVDNCQLSTFPKVPPASLTFTETKIDSSCYRIGAGPGSFGYYVGSPITLSNYAELAFYDSAIEVESNLSGDGGGAIRGWPIAVSNNGSVIFRNNSFTAVSSLAYGGAISGSEIIVSGNGNVTFELNYAMGAFPCGGAIEGNRVSLSDNETINFYKNTVRGNGYASSNGGAIKTGGSSTILSITNNGNVSFTENSAINTSSAGGGAISSTHDIMLSHNGIISFYKNIARTETGDACGGAMSVGNDGAALIGRNGQVHFIENVASSNSAAASGGAIYSYGNLNIRDNAYVLFEKNVEITKDYYRLRSIYVGGYQSVLALSTNEKGTIEFRDSVFATPGTTVKFNGSYTDEFGNIHQQAGDIIFTGAYTVDDLYVVKGKIAGTEEEIQLSRTSEV